MKPFFLVLLFLTLMPITVWSHPVDKASLRSLNNRQALRSQMSLMVIHIADGDILINRDNNLDYELLQEDGQQILETIGRIRKLDTTGFFVDYLKALEVPTKKFIQASTKKDPKVRQYFEEMNNACFSCHKVHRDKKRSNLRMEGA